ncbi:hypothetical protein JYK14_20490 [Siccirubricoccus sp. KC 17139]|uniref:Fibronectin-binding protein n=1 Tax=Siccirubricoccus soli TaxID=2899147 RepID=A0ABT1D9C0_9PROT|nr:hypothetical protein [Siccirubricoccus soli]MCO6418523.1 hypothetical protein [Siccirubricoccus soli]MCP2684658.1 hypothetical protein [Siccirubricoccus soli]
MRPLLRLALPALLALLLWGALVAPAAAQIREGRYAVEGNNPDGAPYTGQFALQAGPGGAWIAVWQVGNVRLAGLGIIEGGVLCIGFAAEGRPGVAAYQVEADGKLRGSWTTGGGVGQETLTPE